MNPLLQALMGGAGGFGEAADRHGSARGSGLLDALAQYRQDAGFFGRARGTHPDDAGVTPLAMGRAVPFQPPATYQPDESMGAPANPPSWFLDQYRRNMGTAKPAYPYDLMGQGK